MSDSSSDLYLKARELMDNNQFAEAAELFEKSSTISPHFKTLELLGECYIHLNLLRKAIIPLAASVSLNSGIRAASLLADVFFNLQDYNGAKNMAEIALSRDSKNRIAQNVLKKIENI